jgi:hypothetical protein
MVAEGSPTFCSCVLILSGVNVALSVSAAFASATLMLVSTRIRSPARRLPTISEILSMVTSDVCTSAAAATASRNLTCLSLVKDASAITSSKTIFTAYSVCEGTGVLVGPVGDGAAVEPEPDPEIASGMPMARPIRSTQARPATIVLREALNGIAFREPSSGDRPSPCFCVPDVDASLMGPDASSCCWKGAGSGNTLISDRADSGVRGLRP